MRAGSPSSWRTLLAAALALVLGGFGIGVLLPIDVWNTEPVLQPQEQINADAASRFPADATVPQVPPPYMTSLSYVTIERTQHEAWFQQRNRNVVICNVGADTTNSGCRNDGVEVLRTERSGDRTVTVALVPLDLQVAENEGFTAAELDFVRAYWQSVPLQTGDLPAWIIDLAKDAKRPS
ncbi:hypothetical protein [Cellulomonas iranensis]|uniref:DUF3105 domain-containing protein n=1 Tax=Cellulomonas iranensis TaxID=76862 RepID=A0ABU0GEV2_9CELL|nr:hypothetical protein [Cellulomonas iranensis]MDQ0423881.1 hypothetical protein [Cellulomonas iranensis]